MTLELVHGLPQGSLYPSNKNRISLFLCFLMDVWKLPVWKLQRIYGRLGVTFLGSRSEDTEMLKYLLEINPILNSTARMSPFLAMWQILPITQHTVEPLWPYHVSGTLLMHIKTTKLIFIIHTHGSIWTLLTIWSALFSITHFMECVMKRLFIFSHPVFSHKIDLEGN